LTFGRFSFRIVVTFVFGSLKIFEVSMKRYAVLVGLLVVMAALVTGCGGASGAAVGDSVQVHYTGSFDNGTVFESSYGGEPLTFVIGDGSMIAGFDAAVRGMEVGDIKTVTIPAVEAYGEYQLDLVVVLPRDEFEEELEVGQQVQLQNVTSGEMLVFTVVEIADTEVTLDANHPLAGQNLTFDIELVALD